MKKHIYLLSTIILMATLFFSTSAKASERYEEESKYASQNDCNNNSKQDEQKSYDDKKSTEAVNTGSAKLPINNGVVFLLVAGIAIGITTVSKGKQAAVAAVKAR